MGCPGLSALPRPTARPSGVRPGPATHWLWLRGGVGVGTRHQSHSARSCGLVLRAVGAARGRPGGGGALSWVWGVWGWALSHLRPPALGACGRGPLPTGCGCGGCGRRELSPTPQRALWRAGFAPCGGGSRAPGGGGPLAWLRSVQGWVLSHTRRPDLGACGRGLLLTRCGCGGVWALGPVTNPTARAFAGWFCALSGRHEGARVRRLFPGLGASGVGRSPTSDRPPLGRAAGARYPQAVGAVGAGVGTRHRPHNARSGEPVLHAVGAAQGHRGARASCLGVGRPGLGALPHPTARPWGTRPGPATHWLWVHGVWPWGPVSNPTARALVGGFCALWGGLEGARGGGASCLGLGHMGLGALPHRTARPWGVRLGSATH